MKIVKAMNNTQRSDFTFVKGKLNRNNLLKLMLVSTFMILLSLNSVAGSDKSAPKTTSIPKVSTSTSTEPSNTYTAVSMTKEEFLSKIKSLENQRRTLSLQIYQLRVKLIKEDPELDILQKAVMDMHRKMGVTLNKNVDMKQLLFKAKQIDNQMMELINANRGDQS